MMLMRYIFLIFFIKSICYYYSVELPRQVDTIQMITNNIGIYKVELKYRSCNRWTVRL